MQADILCIGDELVIGQVVNTNASDIAEQVGGIGVSVNRIVAVGDDAAMIKAELNQSLSQSDIVLITGGLGPTHDDMTKPIVAEFFGLGYEWNEEAYQNCKGYFDRRNVRMPEANRSQGEVIAGCVVLQNTKGTAPGMIVRNQKGYENKFVVMMPGVPTEMHEMMRVSVLPFFKPLSNSFIKHTTIMTAGIGESHLAERIGNEKEFLTPNSTLAYLPHTMGVRLRVTTRGTNEADVLAENARIAQTIISRAEKFVFATDDVSLEEIIGKMLLERQWTLATAESCTGGMLAHRITNISGSSAYFSESFVLYNNDAKHKTLGVKKETIEKFGAVSEEIALEMVQGCLEQSDSDIAVATTGIAGPTGGTETKPVGMICAAVALNSRHGGKSHVKTFVFGKDRLRNKDLFTQTALNMVRSLLVETP
jgi:nicotinamide-nucleotide amidase